MSASYRPLITIHLKDVFRRDARGQTSRLEGGASRCSDVVGIARLLSSFPYLGAPHPTPEPVAEGVAYRHRDRIGVGEQ